MLVLASSAMNDAVIAGVLKERSFGGMAILVGSKFKRHVKFIAKSSRYIIIKIGTTLIVNVNLPWQITNEIEDEYINCLASLFNEICNVSFKHIITGDDWNIDLNKNYPIKDYTMLFVNDLNNVFVDFKLTNRSLFSYVNTNGGHSTIDHFVVSKALVNNVWSVSINDHALNLSNHCPVLMTISIENDFNYGTVNSKKHLNNCMH